MAREFTRRGFVAGALTSAAVAMSGTGGWICIRGLLEELGAYNY